MLGAQSGVGALACLQVPFWIKSWQIGEQPFLQHQVREMESQSNCCQKIRKSGDRGAPWEGPLGNTGFLAYSPWESPGRGLLLLSQHLLGPIWAQWVPASLRTLDEQLLLFCTGDRLPLCTWLTLRECTCPHRLSHRETQRGTMAAALQICCESPQAPERWPERTGRWTSAIFSELGCR